MTAARSHLPTPTRTQLATLARTSLLDCGALVLSTDLKPGDLASSRTFANARHLLSAVLAEGKVPATKQLGNLSRRFATRMLDELTWPDGYVSEVRRFKRVTDEIDIGKLEYLRVALQHAGLLRKYRGAFLVTKKAERFLRPENAGQLFHDLFVAWFSKTNIGLLDRYPEDPYMQHCMPFLLWRLGHEARAWRIAAELAPGLPHDERIWEAEDAWVFGASARRRPFDSLSRALVIRIFEPLNDFGLLARNPAEEPSWKATPHWRVTPLFDRFVRFDFERVPESESASQDDLVTKDSRESDVAGPRGAGAKTRSKESLTKEGGLMSEFAAHLVESGRLASFAEFEDSLLLFAQWAREAAKRVLIDAAVARNGSVVADVPGLLDSLTASDFLDATPEFITALRESPLLRPGTDEQAAAMIEVFAAWAIESARAPSSKGLTAIAFAKALRDQS